MLHEYTFGNQAASHEYILSLDLAIIVYHIFDIMIVVETYWVTYVLVLANYNTYM